MQHLREVHFKRTDIWREGKWLDLWSVVHVLSGCIIGFVAYLVPLDPLIASVITVIGLILYEIWEKAVGIVETPHNHFTDVAVGMVGFIAIYFYIAPILTQELFAQLGIGASALNLVLSTLGWRASHKARGVERRMKARYARERIRFLRSTKRLRARAERLREAHSEPSTHNPDNS